MGKKDKHKLAMVAGKLSSSPKHISNISHTTIKNGRKISHTLASSLRSRAALASSLLSRASTASAGFLASHSFLFRSASVLLISLALLLSWI